MKKVRSTKYISKQQLHDKTSVLSMENAVDKIQSLSYTKFVGSIETHINLSTDPRKSDQRISFNVTLPHSIGKSIVVLAIAAGDDAIAAKNAGADIVGGAEMIDKIAKGWVEFDAVVTTPDMMKELSKVAKVLGPKGLMPNPKNGTVAVKLDKAVEIIKKGQITLKSDDSATIRTVVGKIGQNTEEVVKNLKEIIKLIQNNKPAKLKGNVIKSIFIAPTMGPSIKLEVQ